MPRKTQQPGEIDAVKADFGRRLQSLILERNWNQADLARAAGLGRDSISTYIRGQVFPDPKNLKKIADALGVTPQQIYPSSMSAAMETEIPTLEIRQSITEPDKVHIRVNRTVSLEQAAKIFDIIRNQ
jgi:transcriptional regulator with XRE-family HTH domain